MSDPDLPRPTPCNPPRWQRRPEARPDEIIEAALDVFGEQGYARARLEDVAHRAGVSKGTVYLYFDSKDALFREAIRTRIGTNLRAAAAFVEQFEGSSRELLAALLRRMWTTIREKNLSRITKLVQSELASFPELAQFYFDEVIRPSRALIQSVLDRGAAAGEFRPVPNGFAARAMPALVIHMVMMERFFRQFDPEALSDEQAIEGIIDVCLHGVLAPRASAGERSGGLRW